MSSRVQRKLTTILAADAAGYSRAMDNDEVGAFGELRAAKSVFSSFIERHYGRIVNTAGDGLIAEFPSVVEAVQCAIEIQNELGSQSRDRETALRFRIGIHLGDVMVDGSDLLGEGVNLAARLEAMAEPGGVMISQQVYDQVQRKLSVGFEYLGEKRPKNFEADVAVYRLSLGGTQPSAASTAGKARPVRSPPQTQALPEDASPEGQRERITRLARLLGALWFMLLLIDLFTGEGFWVHWPGLAMGTFLALNAAPLFARDGLRLSYVRGIVIVFALALVNLFTWPGYLWVIWPAGGIVVIELFRRLGVGCR